jgi:hypothetical protein
MLDIQTLQPSLGCTNVTINRIARCRDISSAPSMSNPNDASVPNIDGVASSLLPISRKKPQEITNQATIEGDRANLPER